jgi:hypothetical protein
MTERKHLFNDDEKVRIKETGEIVTVYRWWFYKPNPSEGVHSSCAQYDIKEYPGTWFAEYELEKVEDEVMRKHGIYVGQEMMDVVKGDFRDAVKVALECMKETGLIHHAKPLEEIRTDNSYELLAVRYGDDEEHVYRHEFLFMEAQQAMIKYLERKNDGHAFVELTIIEAKRG